MEREEIISGGGTDVWVWEGNCQREEGGDVSETRLGFNNRTASCELGSHKPETLRHERKADYLHPKGLRPVIHLSKVYFHHPLVRRNKCYVIYVGVRPGLVLE
jgi:hypothetical protein